MANSGPRIRKRSLARIYNQAQLLSCDSFSISPRPTTPTAARMTTERELRPQAPDTFITTLTFPDLCVEIGPPGNRGEGVINMIPTVTNPKLGMREFRGVRSRIWRSTLYVLVLRVPGLGLTIFPRHEARNLDSEKLSLHTKNNLRP